MQTYRNCFTSRPGSCCLTWLLTAEQKANPNRSTPYDSDTVALEKQPESTRITRKGDPIPRSLHPHMWGRKQQIYTRKCEGNQVRSRNQVAHILPKTKGGLLGSERVLLEPNSTHSYRQHHSGCLYKGGLLLGPVCVLR